MQDDEAVPVISGIRLVLLGRQGAGKGTQCARLSEHYGVPHISTGEMLRAAVRDRTEFGRKAEEYMDRGELVPDDVTIGILTERLAMHDARHGYVLDGFPRTVAQAQVLDELNGDQSLDLVIDLDVPEPVVLERLAGRRVCSECGANYSLSAPPKSDWRCDVCGGEVIQRADDTEDAVRRRLALYERETAPLIDYYRDRKVLVSIDGLGDLDAVTARLIQAIDSRRRVAHS